MKKVLAILMAVCMLLMMIPAVTVSAASISWPAIGENVTIGGETFEYIGVMSENFAYISITADDDVGTPYAGKFGSGYFTWDGEDTLVLHNTTGNFEELYSVVNIEALSVNIVLEGKNVWNIGNVYEYSYAIDLYRDEDDTNPPNSYVISGGGSIEINTTAVTYAQAIWSNAPLYIDGVTIDANLSANEVSGIGRDYLEISNANLSINGTVSSAEYECSAIYAYNDMQISNSRITGKMVALATSDAATEVPYVDFMDADGDILINNSIISGEVVSQGWAYGIVAGGNIEIRNNSAVELKGIGDDSHVIMAFETYIDNSYVYATTDNGAAIVTYDAEDGDIILSDFEFLTPTAPYGEVFTAADGREYATIANSEGIAKTVMVAPRSYSDVSAAQWFAPAVCFATARGLFQGVDQDNFAPDMNFTRAQMMTVLARMAGEDVTPAAGEIWYEKAVAWAKNNGISDGTNPDGKITREQMITMVWRYLGEPEGAGDLDQFTDSAKIDSWAEDALAWAVEYGVISGRGNGVLDPDGNATRAEAAQLLKNFLINY